VLIDNSAFLSGMNHPEKVSLVFLVVICLVPISLSYCDFEDDALDSDFDDGDIYNHRMITPPSQVHYYIIME